MDNLAHTLCATALGKTKLGKMSPLAPAALVVAANIPDADGFPMLFGDRAEYLICHRGITHSLIGVIIQLFILQFIFRWMEKKWCKNPSPSFFRGTFWPLAAGLLSHPALDYLNTYGIRPFLPIWEDWIYGDLVFIVDPVLWLVFGSVTALAGNRSKWGSYLLLAIALFTSWLSITHSRSPDYLPWIWIPVVSLVSLLRWQGLGSVRPHRVLWSGLVVFILYLGGLSWAKNAAWNHAKDTIGASVGEIQKKTMSPGAANPWKWRIAGEGPEHVFWAYVNLDGEMTFFKTAAKGTLLPWMMDAIPAKELKAWKVFSRHPWVALSMDKEHGYIHLMDARYQMHVRKGWASSAPQVDREKIEALLQKNQK